MYLDDALLYNQGYMISINDLDSPLFYLFDYDSRSFKINMSFSISTSFTRYTFC